jgi:hypothetical protein
MPTEPDDTTDGVDSLTRSRLVDHLAEAGHTAIRAHSRARGDDDVPTWADLDQRGRNRIRALVVALVTDDRPDLDALLAALGHSTAHQIGPEQPGSSEDGDG